MVTGTPYHTRLAPPPASGWTPLEMTFEVATGRQNDGLKEDTVANASVDFQRRVAPVVSQRRLNFDTTA
jgi:hypothetical protein